jgi:hypothetical protein
MARAGSERCDGDWCRELAALKSEPVLMLLAAVYLRAKQDANDSQPAKQFVERVRANCRELEDPGYAVVMAMRGHKSRMEKPARLEASGRWQGRS